MAIRAARRIRSDDVMHALTGLFASNGVPGHIRSDNGPEFTAKAVRDWLPRVGVQTLLTDASGVVPEIGTWAICAQENGPPAGSGTIIEFRLTRVATGNAILSFSESGPLPTVFIEAGVLFADLVPPISVDTSVTLSVV